MQFLLEDYARLVILLIQWFEHLGWKLSAHLLNFDLIAPEFLVFVFELVVELVEISLEPLDLALLDDQLCFEPLLFLKFILLSLSELPLQSFQVSFGVKCAIRVRVCLLCVQLHLRLALSLFVFY